MFALLMTELLAHQVEHPEETVGRGAMDVEPDRIGAGWRGELPVDRRLAAAFAVALDVRREELRGKPTAQVGGAQQIGRLLPAGVGIVEDDLEHGAHSADQILRVARVIDQQAIGGESKRVAGWGLAERQSIVSDEHAGGADGQRIKRFGLWRCWALAGGQSHVEAAEGNAQRPGEQ